MAESKIITALIQGLSGSDPALTATSSETAKYDINCGPENAPSFGDGKGSVVFPSGSKNAIPSGGCVIKQAGFKTPTENDSETVSNKKSIFFTELKNVKSNIKTIFDLKKEVSRLFYDVFFTNSINNKTTKIPDIYLSIYKADDGSEPPANGSNSNVKTISQFFYIPAEVLINLIPELYTTSYKSLLEKNSGFALNFDDYKNAEGNKSEEKIINLLLEFIPFFNYSFSQLEGESFFNGIRDHGGYFTSFSDSIYIKLPDISARNYRAIFSDFYEDFSYKFLLQYYFPPDKNPSGNTVSSTVENIVLNFENVFGGEIIEHNDFYPFGDAAGEFKVEITGFNLTTDLIPYLSIILEDKAYSEKIPGYNDTDQQFVDLHPCPNSEYFINSEKIRNYTVSNLKMSNGELYIDYKVIKSAREIYNEYLEKYVKPEDLDAFSVEKSGPPTLIYDKYAVNRGGTPYDIFGDLSRQDELLAAKKSGIFNLKKPGVSLNYFSSKAMNSSNFGLQIRPRIYQNYHIPKSWIKGKLTKQDEDTYVAIFSNSDLNKIKASDFKFALYLSDQKGQIYRISNQVMVVPNEPPGIENISPSGYLQDGVVVSAGSRLSVSGENFSPTKTKAFIDATELVTQNITSSSLVALVPSGVVGFKKLKLKNGSNVTDEKDIYVSADPTASASDLPTKPDESLNIKDNFVVAKNLGEIPISYDSVNSKIYLKSRKATFKKQFLGAMKAYLYVKPYDSSDKKIIDFISNDYYINSSESTYIFNDVSWTLSSNLDSDFSIQTKRKAAINIPGTSNYKKPLQYLSYLNNNADVGIYITIEKNVKSISSSNSLSVSLKENGVPAFSLPPYVLAMAGSTDDLSTETSYFKNFMLEQIPSSSRNAVVATVTKEIFGSSAPARFSLINFSPIKCINNLNKLVIFFNSVSSIEESTQKYKFYIGGKKVPRTKISNLKRLSGNIWCVTISNYDTSSISDGFGEVIVSRKDKIRKNEINSSYLYYELTSDNTKPDLIKVTDEGGNSEQASLTKNLIFPKNSLESKDDYLGLSGSIENSDIFKFYLPGSFLFGTPIQSDKSSVTQIQVADFSEEIKFQDLKSKNKDTSTSREESVVFHPIQISSLFSDATFYFDSAYSNKLSLSELNINSSYQDISYLPLYAKIPSQSLLTNYQKASVSTYSGYKSYHRIRVKNQATIVINSPKIISIDKETAKSGDVLTLITEGVNTKKSKVYINKTRAKILEAKQNKLRVIVPKGVDKCAEITIKPTKLTLISAEGDLGLKVVNDVLASVGNVVNGIIADKMGDVQALIDKIKEKFLKFLSLHLDKVNIAKELINSFCDMSFHLTAELNIYLKNFSIILIPIKVIFCIIDVICSLLNPVKLASAIIRLFECLYDLLLMLPQIAIPVLILQLFLHLLELLECLIEKIINTVGIITIIINAIAEVSNLIDADAAVDFKYLMMLEGVLLDNFLTIEADLQVLGPIVQIFALVLELLQLVFRFPCNIGPQSGMGDCGIDGTMLGGMIIGTVSNEDGSIKTEYLLPVSQTISTNLDPISDENLTVSKVLSSLAGSDPDIINPVSGAAVLTKSSGESFYDSLEYNEDNFRFSQNNNVSFVSSYTKIIKSFSQPQRVKILFNDVGNQSLFNKYIDKNSPIDSPISLLYKSSSESLVISNATTQNNRNFYSMIDGESFISVDEVGSDIRGNVLPLSLPISINDVIEQRTFSDLPKMVLMDDKSNIYKIEENGIVFDSDYKIKAIFAQIINTNAASNSSFSKDDVETSNDLDGDGDISENEIENFSLYSFPKLYFVDVRAASEQIQTQCSTSSLNNILIEQGNVDETTDIVTEVKDCLDKFINSITGKVREMREETSLGAIPTPFEDNFVQNLAEELRECINNNLDKICKQVVNVLNTSFKVLEDNDETPLDGFPDLVVPDEVMGDFTTDGPPLTGAREYAAGIGDSASIFVNSIATIEIIPRDSYDDIITPAYDLSDKIDIQILSDTTGNARIIPKNYNGALKNVIPDGSGRYYAYITSSKAGIVKIRSQICNRPIQALTYAGIENLISPEDSGTIDCIPDSAVDSSEAPIVPLGALSKVDRILTIEFKEKTNTIVSVGGVESELVITNPGLFGVGE